MILHYQKRKNTSLFESLEKKDSLYTSKTQNYVPIYKRFFSLNNTNYNNVNLNHKLYISKVKNNVDDNPNLFNCLIENTESKKEKNANVFFKLAPLLDPCKYLIGKYNVQDPNLFKLPHLESNDSNTYSKILDWNNSAYVDSFFVYLTSKLLYEHNFIHGIDFYGSFLTIKNNYKVNVFDDLEYLNESDFFNKNKNKLFEVDNYDFIINSNEDNKLPPIKIHDSSLKSNCSIQSISENVFDNVFDDNDSDNKVNDANIIAIDLNNFGKLDNADNNYITTIKSTSTCSSRTSHTLSEKNCNDCNNCNNCNNGNICSNCIQNNDNFGVDNESMNSDKTLDDGSGSGSDFGSGTGSDSDSLNEEEEIYVTFPKFPVQIICMENCECTFDELIFENELNNDEWYSALMQIIMILITYQKSFSLTHNDLHTNNVMYNYTNKKYIYYKYNNVYYKVPTFGRLFKIIDFGRAIYKFNNDTFCSDSFNTGGDAATQYNIEPYLNVNKPRLEPNYSFDLCRLACSIFDNLIDDMSNLQDIIKENPVAKIITEWCLDDNGINILYKNNGEERYPDFKLYKMIARCVHNHTPQLQLDRPEFKKFSNFTFKKEKFASNELIDIDAFPIY